MKRQSIRMLLLLLSFSVFPITIIYLAPAPPIMSLKAGVINLSVITVLSVFLSGIIFRRAFCGWLCPGGGCQLVAQPLNNKAIKEHKTNWVRIGLVIVWVLIMILVTVFGDQAPKFDVAHPGAGKFATSDIRYFLPYIPTVIFIFLFVLFFGRRGFCHRGCWIYPLIAFSTKVGTMIRIPSFHISMIKIDKCSNCKLCSKNCSMSIDVHKHVQEKKVFPNNCIQCGNCVDKCTKGVLSFSFSIQKAPTA